MAARKRFISKGNITIIDGLDETQNQFAKRSLFFRRTTKLDKVLSHEVKLLWSKSPRIKKKDPRRRVRPAERTNISEEELERQRLIKEIQEAEDYELIIERDSDLSVRKHDISLPKLISSGAQFVADAFLNLSAASRRLSGFGKGDSTAAEVSDVNKNSTKGIPSIFMNSDLSLGKNKSKTKKGKSHLLFFGHPTEPTTSTPIKTVQPTRSSPHQPSQQDMHTFDGYAGLSPIILDKENVLSTTAKKMIATVYLNQSENEVKPAGQLVFADQTNSSVQPQSKEAISVREETNVTPRRISLSQLTIFKSPGNWGFGDEECVSEDVVSSVSLQFNRSLSLCDGTGDNRPFYLNGFPWTAQYSKKRDYMQELFHLCNQKSIQMWRVGKAVLDLSNPVKLGEGTFGEVFLVKYKGEVVALKVIPIGGTKLVNGDKQKSFRDIAAELIVSKELSNLNQAEDGCATEGFIRLMGATVVKGSYPKSLIAAWEKYDERVESENDHPRIFDSSQHFLLLAFENGGIDLEKYEVASVLQAYSIVYQVLMALSVAEYRLSFEHRDLHCGNILVRNVERNACVRENLNGTEVSICTYGAEVKIIDFTLSRMSKGTSTIFYDLAKDEELFAGEGCLQYDIYRVMRLANKNNWFSFCSVTNVAWLIYLVRYLYDNMSEKRTGSLKERKGFIYHFKHLNRYGSLSEWLIENADKRSDIIHFVDGLA